MNAPPSNPDPRLVNPHAAWQLPPRAAYVITAVLLTLAAVGAGAANSGSFYRDVLASLFVYLGLAGSLMIFAASSAPERVQRIAILTISIVASLGFVAVVVFGLGVFRDVAGYLLATGVGFLIQERTHRLGDQLHCAKCEYPLTPADNCPECGAPWTWPRTLVRGTRHRRRWLQAAAWLLIVTGTLAAVAGFSRHTLARLLPTSMLVTAAVRPNGDFDVFSELDRRALSPAERSSIINGLLALRDAGHDHTSAQFFWLSRVAQSNLLTTAQLDRYCNSLLKLRARVVGEPRVGQSVRVELFAEGSRWDFASGWLHVWLAGWTLQSGVTPPVALGHAWSDWDSATRFDAELISTLPTSGPTLLPHIEITPSAAGRHTVRATLHIIAGPGPFHLVLNDDGTPRFAGRAVPVWTRRVEVEATMDVRP